MTGTTIIGLLGGVSPDAIIWLIVTAVIFAFYRQSLHVRWVHIGNKIPNVEPSFTDYDSPSAVVDVGFIFRVGASLVHSSPDRIERMLIHSVFEMTLFVKASAAYLRARCQGVYSCRKQIRSTIALADCLSSKRPGDSPHGQDGNATVFQSRLNRRAVSGNKIKVLKLHSFSFDSYSAYQGLFISHLRAF